MENSNFDYFVKNNMVNIYGENFDLFQRIKNLIKILIRLNYSPSYKEFLQAHSNLLITDF